MYTISENLNFRKSINNLLNYFAAFCLILIEARRSKFKMYKTFLCATFVMYETIALISIIAYVCPMVYQLSVEFFVIFVQNMLSEKMLLYFVDVMHFIAIFILIFSHWIKNTVVHFSVCWYEILQTWSINPYYWNKRWISTSSALIFILMAYTVYTLIMSPIEQSKPRYPVFGVICIWGLYLRVSSKFKQQLNS